MPCEKDDIQNIGTRMMAIMELQVKKARYLERAERLEHETGRRASFAACAWREAAGQCDNVLKRIFPETVNSESGSDNS